MSRFYLTTAIPYINGKPHVGHLLEWFQADAIAKYHRSLGKEVAFVSGSDENSLKNVQAAEKNTIDVQTWLDDYSSIFKKAYQDFDISLTEFRRGSDQQKHWPGVQKLWQACQASGDIYTKSYQGLYCVGCEQFYTESELVDGHCPEHLTEPEKISETNYFFKLSKYQDQIYNLIESDQLFIAGEQYKQEMLGFIRQGLEDFSISRSVERARGVGVPVPGDDQQIMYVWFDALTIYMTGVGFGTNQENWKKWWPADVHVIGKGINRFHSIYWIGMLLSAGLPIPKAISVHGYITADGQKMGKSLGNVLDPYQLKEQYGLEPLRYYLLKAIPTHGDGDFNHQKFGEVYTADLANGLGNVCSRIASLAAKLHLAGQAKPTSFDKEYCQLFEKYLVSDAAEWLINQVSQLDHYLSDTKPWKLSAQDQKPILETAISKVLHLALHFKPFLPDTAEKIATHFSSPQITKLQPLFPRFE